LLKIAKLLGGLTVAVEAGTRTLIIPASSVTPFVDMARTDAADERTEGTEDSVGSCAEPREVRWGSDSLGNPDLVGVIGLSEKPEIDSISRSKIAEDDECMEVGEEGMEEGRERLPGRTRGRGEGLILLEEMRGDVDGDEAGL